MVKQGRTQGGKFASKSDEPRLVRTMRLTDITWQKLGEIAESRGITRADLIERIVESGALNQQSAGDQISLQQVESSIAQILNDSTVTRGGKDRGAVKRALEALLKQLF